MLVYRSASMLHFYKLSPPPKLLLSRLKHSCSYISSSPLSSLSSPTSSLRIRLFWLNQSSRRGNRFSTAAAAALSDKVGNDTFFADEGVSWASLGLSDRLCRAISNVRIERPSLVQVSRSKFTHIYIYVYF